jgi:hypothetical protein
MAAHVSWDTWYAKELADEQAHERVCPRQYGQDCDVCIPVQACECPPIASQFDFSDVGRTYA